MKKQDLVADYLIEGGYKLVSIPSLRKSNICYLITVGTLTGKKLNICICPYDTVEQLKKEIQKAEGIPPDQQNLVYNGIRLEDGHSLCTYKIQKESIVHLVLRLRGGMMYMSSMARFQPEQAAEKQKVGEKNAIRCPSCNDMLKIENNAGSSMAQCWRCSHIFCKNCYKA